MNKEPLKHCPKCKSAIFADAPGGLCPHCLLQFVAISTGGADFPIDDRSPRDLESIRAAFPQLEILELIGQGGMGTVYKARQPKLDRIVALKILPLRLARESSFAERFEREGRLLARLNHPNIVGVYDFGQTDGHYYLIMEYVDGVNLRQAFASTRFTPQQALSVIPKICEALQFAHDEGVLHRDIKPENILLDTKGRVKIADFGIAKFAGVDDNTGLTATGATIGTPHYMAPEQIEQPANVDHRADIFSLGVVFYEMLTGELPLGRFAAPSERTATVDARIDDVVMRALEKDRERRQQSANEVRTQVEMLSNPSNSNRKQVETSGTRPLIVNPNASFQRYSARPTIAIVLVLASISIPVSIAVQHEGPSDRLVFSLGLISAWFGIPGTLLGLTHLLFLQRSGARNGLQRGVIAGTLWPCGLAIGWCLVLANGIITQMQGTPSPAFMFMANAVCLCFGIALSFVGMWMTRQKIQRSLPDPNFITSVNPSPFASTLKTIMKAFVVSLWAFFGLIIVYMMSGTSMRPTSMQPKTMPSYMVPQHLRLEVVSTTTKENVLIAVVKDPSDNSFQVDFRGFSLLPKAEILASESYQGKCIFPGERSDILTFHSDNEHTLELAFALPDAETALACKNRMERQRGNAQPYTYNSMTQLFKINSSFGEYEAFALPAVTGYRMPDVQP